jgi:hypothetical protein
MVQILDAVLVLDLVLSLETVVVIVCLLRLFAVAVPAGLLSFVFPFTFCSETKRATASDFYDRVSVNLHAICYITK